MCFTIFSADKKPLVATKDIPVYKRLVKILSPKDKKKYYYKSPYQDFIYEPGECYFENEAFRGARQGSISKGLHSYVSEKYARRYKWTDEKVIKCIIPKGAKYFINAEQYVSDYLIIGK